MRTCFILLPFIVFWDGFEPVPDRKAFEVYANDSLRIEVLLRYDGQDRPEHYFSHFTTPVCKEGLCYLVEISLYWDLLGNFLKYELPPDRPLTKFDHEPFTEADYQKLHDILADKRSLLGEHRIEDLVDESTERVSEEVDAVTGATIKSVENTVVSGAVFTTYTLWHLVNGEIAERIPAYTESLVDEALLEHFLTSDHYPYHYYALDALSDEQYPAYMPHILRLMETGSIFVARYALNRIPAAVYEDPRWQAALVGQFGQADFATQTLLLKKLQSVAVGPESLSILTRQLDQLSEQQIQQILQLVLANREALTEEITDRIVQLLYHSSPVYAEPAYRALLELSPSHDRVKKALNDYETSAPTNE